MNSKKKKIIPLHGNVKSLRDNQVRIKRLNLLDEEMLTSTIKDIYDGAVSLKTLRILCGIVGHKIKTHNEFQSAADKYVAKALISIEKCADVRKSFGFIKGSRNKNIKLSDLKIAYTIWLAVHTQLKMPKTAIYETAKIHKISPDKARNIYYKHKSEIDKKYEDIENKIF